MRRSFTTTAPQCLRMQVERSETCLAMVMK
jgi:hypothetical protein